MYKIVYATTRKRTGRDRMVHEYLKKYSDRPYRGRKESNRKDVSCKYTIHDEKMKVKLGPFDFSFQEGMAQLYWKSSVADQQNRVPQ